MNAYREYERGSDGFERKREQIRANCPFFDLMKGVVIVLEGTADVGDVVEVPRHDGSLASVRLVRHVSYHRGFGTVSYEIEDSLSGEHPRLMLSPEE